MQMQPDATIYFFTFTSSPPVTVALCTDAEVVIVQFQRLPLIQKFFTNLDVGHALAADGLVKPLVVVHGVPPPISKQLVTPRGPRTLSPLVGTGPGRGYAFLFFLVGVVYVGVWILNLNNKNLKNLSRQVKDITNH